MKVWSWRQAIQKSELPSTTKLVLLNLSIYMNEVGEGCYPTTATQAKDTGLSERSVCTHLDNAEKAGFLLKSLHGYGGQKWSRNEYFATYPKGTELDAKALNLTTEGTEPDDKKALKEVQSNTPYNTPVNSLEGDTAPKKKKQRFSIDKPDDIEQQVWDDYIAIRRQKKTPYTHTAHSRNVSQAQKAGVSINEALVFACHKGWQSFTADYYFNATKGNTNGTNGKKTRGQQSDETFLKVLHSRHLERSEGS